MTKETRLYSGEKTVSSVNGAGKTVQLYVKNEIRTFSNTIYKNKRKCIKYLSVRLDTVRLLEENIGRTLFFFNEVKLFSLFDVIYREMFDSRAQGLFFSLFIYLFLAVLGLCFCARAFSGCGKRGPLFIAVCGPLTVAASLVVEHRLQLRRLSSCGSWA